MESFLFYDIETTGLNKSFDQVLQFAAVRTDKSLREIDRYSSLIRLRPDVIPSPQAMITHQIPVADILSGEKTKNEFEATRDIHALLNEPGTISTGYNTLRFDDEFLRFSFHRNLLPPYTHQYAAGCGRLDLLPMAVIYCLFKPQVLMTWPEVDGKMSLKLEHISAANHLACGRAHDAMTDVMATLELARCFMREKPVWDYLLDCFDKRTDRQRTSQCPEVFQSVLGSHRFGLLTGAEYGADRRYLVPVLSIGESVPYSNQTLWLRLDLPELRQVRSETIETDSWVIRKRYGEPPIILPPLDRYLGKIGAERQAIYKDNIRWLQSQNALFEQIVRYHREFRYPIVPDVDADAALYQNGFLSSRDRSLCARFHQAALVDKMNMVEDFSDEVTRELAARVICRNYLDSIPEGVRRPDSVQKRCRDFFTLIRQTDQALVAKDYRGEPRMVIPEALKEIREIEAEGGLNEDQMRILDALGTYLMQRDIQQQSLDHIR